MYENIMQNSYVESTYMIMHFPGDIRMSNGLIQSKIVEKKKTLLKILYYDDDVHFIPYTRTEAFEFSAALPNLDTVQTYIKRTVIHNFELINSYMMRIALEESVDDHGSLYTLTAEVEYDQLTFTFYTANKKIEDLFFSEFTDRCMYYIDSLTSKKTFKFKPSEIMTYGSRVFRHLNESYTSSQKEQIMFKFDGYKCKLAIKGGILTFYDARHNYCSGYCTALNKYENIVFQGEILENDVIFIVDILGGFINNKKELYMPQPLEVLEFFEWFRNDLKKSELIEPFNLTLLNQNRKQKTFKVFTQYPVVGNLTSQYPIDGYIIIQNSNLLKYKIPTIDVKIENGYLKVSGRIRPISDEEFPDLEESKIYEVQQKKDNSYKILKIRYDRIIPCTNEEYENYIKELEFIRSCVRASNSKSFIKTLVSINSNLKEKNSNSQETSK